MHNFSSSFFHLYRFRFDCYCENLRRPNYLNTMDFFFEKPFVLRIKRNGKPFRCFVYQVPHWHRLAFRINLIIYFYFIFTTRSNFRLFSFHSVRLLMMMLLLLVLFFFLLECWEKIMLVLRHTYTIFMTANLSKMRNSIRYSLVFSVQCERETYFDLVKVESVP